MLMVLLWYAHVVVLGWLAFPLTAAVCTRLHDRGYGISRALGLILTTYLAWLLGSLSVTGGKRPLIEFSYGSALLSVAIMAALSLAIFLRQRRDLTAFLRGFRRELLVIELVSLVAFLWILVLRSKVPHISFFLGGDSGAMGVFDHAAEKFTDFAVLNGLLASTQFPPADPWMAGHTMNYYYFGHLIWAALIKLTKIRPEIAFNLSLATCCAVVAVQGASIGYNLTRRVGWMIIAALLITAAGNLDGFLQGLALVRTVVSGTASSVQAAVATHYDFWRSSRAVADTITEFPAFSFILGDLHAHLSCLMIVLAALGLLLQVWRSAAAEGRRSLSFYAIMRWPELALLALFIGAMGAANSWDAITVTMLSTGVLWVARCRKLRPDEGRPIRHALHNLSKAIPTALLMLVVAVVGTQGLFRSHQNAFHPPLPPLVASCQVGPLEIGRLPAGWSPDQAEASMATETRPGATPDAFFATKWQVSWKREWALRWVYAEGPLKPVEASARTSFFEFISHWLLLALWPVILAGTLMRRAVRSARNRIRQGTDPNAALPLERMAALASLALAVACVLMPVTKGWVASLLPVAAVALIGIIAAGVLPPALALLAGIGAVFAVLAQFCEMFFLDDIFSPPIERINTVFKIYYGLWPALAVAAVLALRRLVRYAPQGTRGPRAAWLLLPLLMAAGTYPVLGSMQRVLSATRLGVANSPAGYVSAESRAATSPESWPKSLNDRLDGLRYLQYYHPADYAAVMWMRDRRNTPADAVIFEAANAGSYGYESRFATTTGRKTIVGWGQHEWAWRGQQFQPEKERRVRDVEELYTTSSAMRAFDIAARYGAQFVVVGALERRKYPALLAFPPCVQKFDAIAERVFEAGGSGAGGTVIYRLRTGQEVANTAAAFDADPANVPPRAPESETESYDEDTTVPAAGTAAPAGPLSDDDALLTGTMSARTRGRADAAKEKIMQMLLKRSPSGSTASQGEGSGITVGRLRTSGSVAGDNSGTSSALNLWPGVGEAVR